MRVGTVGIVTRGSQIAAELLVITVTWLYTYWWRSHQERDIHVGPSISSFLMYNGEFCPCLCIN